MRKIHLLLLLGSISGCAHLESPPSTYSIRPMHEGWENLFENDPDLAGIDTLWESHYPKDSKKYQEKHPPGVMYVFWDGRIYQTSHEPDGDLIHGFWHDDPVPHDSLTWRSIDYSFGSDPGFERHPSPDQRGIKGEHREGKKGRLIKERDESVRDSARKKKNSSRYFIKVTEKYYSSDIENGGGDVDMWVDVTDKVVDKDKWDSSDKKKQVAGGHLIDVAEIDDEVDYNEDGDFSDVFLMFMTDG